MTSCCSLCAGQGVWNGEVCIVCDGHPFFTKDAEKDKDFIDAELSSNEQTPGGVLWGERTL